MEPRRAMEIRAFVTPSVERDRVFVQGRTDATIGHDHARSITRVGNCRTHCECAPELSLRLRESGPLARPPRRPYAGSFRKRGPLSALRSERDRDFFFWYDRTSDQTRETFFTLVRDMKKSQPLTVLAMAPAEIEDRVAAWQRRYSTKKGKFT